MRCSLPAQQENRKVLKTPQGSGAGPGSAASRPLLFFLFFVSGFCGLVYQLVWTRLAFAAFGIITPVMSVVISVFMLGLSVGSWAGGKWVGPVSRRTGLSGAVLYGAAEFCIGLGAFCVPALFAAGARLLQNTGGTDSFVYLTLSAVMLALSILPWCLFMGATFPLMMAYMRENSDARPETFSFLYLGNVLGATIGIAMAALVLIEVFGFNDTLRVAAAGNFIIAVISFRLGWRKTAPKSAVASVPSTKLQNEAQPGAPGSRFIKWVLFTTGFVSMAMEVVWTRSFAPILKTQVYSFAMVVAAYLAATFAGSWLYRRHLAGRKVRSIPPLLLLLCFSALLPVFALEACFHAPMFGYPIDTASSVALLLASICPFCGILGYLTPRLIDDVAAGSPSAAGKAYAINVVGCILGPLVSSYGLLSILSERHALILLALPCFAFFLLSGGAVARRRLVFAGAAVALAAALLLCRSFEQYVFHGDKNMRAKRDYAASVIAVGQGMSKWLLVNGNSMTSLTPITKFMAHLPLAFHQGKPESVLVICFGMGTTFRSGLSWDVPTTAVELVPSVPKMFGFFFKDADDYLKNPKGRIVIDDGRRFLNRTADKFDVIIIDPPPPVEAAGSSLLYSKEFYDAATRRLKPGGIIQAWVPENITVASAALRSLCDSFPYVRCFGSVEGAGVHMLASMEPLSNRSAAELIARMPKAAQADLVEWAPGKDPTAYLGAVLRNEITLDKLLPENKEIRITDDQPYNEYFLLRKYGLW